MKVYLVFDRTMWDGDFLVGVYSTMEKAVMAQRETRRADGGTHPIIAEYQLDPSQIWEQAVAKDVS